LETYVEFKYDCTNEVRACCERSSSDMATFELFIYIVCDCIVVNVKECGRSGVCLIEVYPSIHVGELMNAIKNSGWSVSWPRFEPSALINIS
jgi:hypothetical protein